VLFKVAVFLVLLYFPLKWISSVGIRMTIENRRLWRKTKNVLFGFIFLFIYSIFLIEKSPELLLGKSVSSLFVAVLLIVFLSGGREDSTEIWIRGFLITIIYFLLFLTVLPSPSGLKFRFVNVALREEGFKFLGILSLFLMGKVRGKSDSIIAGASVGGLFGSLENYFYGERFGFTVFAVRNLLPTHLVISGLMGFLFYLSLKAEGVKKIFYILLTVAIPVFLHWAYDYSLQFNTTIYPYIALDFLLYAYLYLKSRLIENK